MTPERYDKLKFDLWMSQHRVKTADWFTAQLFRLFNKADQGNRHRLAKGFSDEYQVYQDWEQSPDENIFYGSDLIAHGRKELTEPT